jgi:phytoene dehydrogenase-like protein
MLADVAWDVSTRPFPWPPESAADWLTLAQSLRPQTFRALPYLLRTIGSLIPRGDTLLHTFLDAQLLISAQTTAAAANALYGSAALDLPRRGVNQVDGGIGSIATTLVAWIRANGGEVRFRQQVVKLEVDERKRVTAAHTRRGERISGDMFLANLTPWGLTRLLGEGTPSRLQSELVRRPDTWGAFTLYLGLESERLPAELADHHQVVVDSAKPLGEGNSVFMSLSDPADRQRAPQGLRAATLSTHTAVTPWSLLRQAGSKQAYMEQRELYTERLLGAAEQAIPGLRQAIRLCLPGTPATFAFYTRRPYGMVGGFPQTSLLAARGPGVGLANLWLVGDSVFPGQSTAGVTLGAMRVATAVLRETPSAG